ncbi:MAG: 4-hydroxythreonine-4-phosphate dehydrogenase PdxA [Alphaproteobacteria bacterium]|nr:4-hydroxythreonine-4-phosphate dehydrogenase PdxA [Alphaproteobacteria bacterium]
MTRAPLAVSLGDPAGVGPELAVSTYVRRAERDTPPFVVVGDPDALRRAARRAGRDDLVVRETSSAHEALAVFDAALPVLPVPLARPETPGAPDPEAAPAIIGAIDAAVAAVRAGEADALVTLPIAKASLYAAGFAYPGHTEYVAHLTRDMPMPGVRGPVMMLAGAQLRVALATIHIPLMQVAAALSVARIVEVATVTAQALVRDFGIVRPRIAVAGLNPHAGEGGALGREEIEIVAPAVAAAREAGVDAFGPVSPDALFHEEARARYDAVVALYHDQGLIAAKTLDFWGTVNVTLGLPIVRTSPDHGTAYDVAGRGVARIDSFVAALQMARAMADARAAAR